MARVSRRRLIQMVEQLEPPVRDAFLRAIARVRSEAVIQRVIDLLTAGRADAIPGALGINSARFSELAEALRVVFAKGGGQGVTELPVLRADPTALAGTYGVARSSAVRLTFDMRNPRAEEWLRRESGRLITGIINDQRELIRVTASEGLALGRNPRQTALDIVGRIGPTGRRTGGIVGLTAQQGTFVTNARAELLSGDPERMRAYLGRQRRDHRFDALVRRAIASGKPVSTADVDKITGRYADRLLQLRGETIARTESLNAFNEAREEAFRQAVDTGALEPENVRKVWSAVMDGRTRDAHRALNGRDVGLEEAFRSPTGAQLMHPGDVSRGAGAADIVNCRCMVTYRVDQIAQAMAA